MFTFINVVFRFMLHIADPSWSCEITHRDIGMPGTYYLYCSKTLPDNVEIVDIGSFVPDKQ